MGTLDRLGAIGAAAIPAEIPNLDEVAHMGKDSTKSYYEQSGRLRVSRRPQ
jgi:hypothetical protein